MLLITPRDDGSSQECGRWADALERRFPLLATVYTTKSRAKLDAKLLHHRHVIYFGHGERNALIVPGGLLRGKTVLADASNLTGTAKRVVVAVACWSSEELGVQATDLKYQFPVWAYLGWLDDVSWPTEWPDPIGEAVVDGLSVFFNGQTVDECCRELKTRLQDAHDIYRSQGPRRMSIDKVRLGKMCALYWSDRSDVKGDGQASL